MKSVLFFFALLIVLSGCSLFDLNGGSSNDAAIRVIVDLEEGESTFLPPFNATLHFAEKQADSRCPLGVDCVWAGEATVLLELTPQGQPTTAFTMTGFVGPDGDGKVVTDTLGLRFTLLSLDPYPVYEVQHDDPSTATLAITRP